MTMTSRAPKLLALVLLASMLLVPRRAAAEPCAPGCTAPPASTTWYGWQTLLVDGGVLGASLVTKSPVVYVGGYVLAAPVVHWVHGEAIRGFASLGLRLAAPLAVGALAFAIHPESADGRAQENAMTWGLLGGGALAIVLDAALLARTTPRREPAPDPRAANRLRVAPHASPVPGGGTAGLTGTF